MRLQQDSNFTTLSWVKPELDETLRLARQALETHVENGADRGQMQVCSAQLHQVQGTLRMVELYGAAMVAEEMEQLANALLGTSVTNREEAYGALMRSIMQLPDYLERLQSGHKDIPMVLLPLLNDLRGARGEKVVPESVLFSVDLSRPLPASVDSVRATLPEAQLRTEVESLREGFQSVLLPWLRDVERPENIATLRVVCSRLVSILNVESARKLFWVAAGILDALHAGAFVASKPLKQALAKLEREIKRIADDGEAAYAAAPPTELTRQLLYYVANAPTDDSRIVKIRETFGLDREQLNEAELAHARGSLTGHNRELLDTVSAGIKEDLLRVKEALDMHLRTTGAPVAELAPQAEALGAIADTLGMLGLGIPRKVVQDQRTAIQALASGKRVADETALLEIAGSLLYVEASLDDQVARLGQAPDQTQDAAAMPLRESQQALDALIKESVANFVQARQCFVAFIEAGWDHAQLHDVPRLLDEVSGAMHLLEQQRAARQLHALSVFTQIELVKLQRVPDAFQMDRLADALASLEYYLEALRDHRPQRDRILELAEHGLVALGYWPVPASAEQTIADAARPKVAPVAPVVPAKPAPVVAEVAPVAPLAEVANDVDQVTDVAIPSVEGAETADTTATVAIEVEEPAPVVPEPVTAAPAPQPTAPGINYGFADNAEIDDDIREVFIEELDEEAANLNELFAEWSAAPTKTDTLRPLRRVFHTLKGSGRLVGALELGEFSWHIESMLNRVLDGSRPASPPVVALVGLAADTLPQFRAALMGAGTVTADIEGLKVYADRIAAGEEVFYVPAPAGPTAAELLEAERVAAERAEAERVEADRVAVARAKAERLEAERVAAARAEAERLEAERVAAERAEAERLEAERAAAERAEAERLEAERVEAATAEAQRLEAERVAAEQAEAERLDAERVAAEQAEAERLEAERLEAERVAAEQAEAERLEGERVAAERAEAERLEAERVAAEQAEAERLEAERVAAEQAEAERLEAERVAAEQAEAERLEAERVAAEQAEAERLEAERVAAEQAEADRLEAERVAAEQAEAERLEAERVAAEQVEAERLAAEQAEAERLEAERVAAEQVEAERLEAERVAAEQAEAERLEAEREAAERAEAAPVAANMVTAIEEEGTVLDGAYASVDPVLLEILRAEVGAHLHTIQQWSAANASSKQHATDALLRAVHTISGAFAMTEVPLITDVLSPTEGYIRRLIAQREMPSASGVALIADVARAIDGVLAALRQPRPMIAPQDELAERAIALRDALPEPTMPTLPVHLEEMEEQAEQAEAEQRVAAERVAVEQADAERVAAERIAAEQAEAERVAAEGVAAEQAEAERVAAERVAAEQAEAERIAVEQAEAARVAVERAAVEQAEAQRLEAEGVVTERAEATNPESEHVAAEQAGAARVESEPVAAEQTEAVRVEADVLDAQQAEAARGEAEGLAAEEAEAERAAAELAEAERLEYERLEAEYAEADRLAAEQQATVEVAAISQVEAESTAAEPIAAEPAAEEPAAAESVGAESVAAEQLDGNLVSTQLLATDHVDSQHIAAEQAEIRRLAAEQETERAAAEEAEAERAAAEQAEALRFAAEQEVERVGAEQDDAERVAAEQEAERVAAEQAEAERVAAEQEAERVAAEQAEAERVAAEQEAERVAGEQAEAERVAAEQEAERVAAEQAEAERVAAEQEAERVAAEQAEAERVAAEQEAERVAAEQAEAERVAAEQEAERVAAEQAEAERIAAEQEAERVAAEQAEAERVAAEQEAERVAAEQAEAERVAAEQEAERVAAEQAEAGRVAAEQEAERVAAQQAEAERVAAEREAERSAAEQAEAERGAAEQEAERVAAEQVEAERVAAEQEAERIAAEQAEAERVAAEQEAERVAAEQAEADRVAVEKMLIQSIVAVQDDSVRIAKSDLEAARAAAKQAESDRVAADKRRAGKAAKKAAAHNVATANAAVVRAEAALAEAERIATERVAAEQAEAEHAAAEKEADRVAAQVEAERIAAEHEAERVAAEQAEAERIAAEQAETERAAAEEAEAERVAADRAATEALGAEVAQAAQQAVVEPSAMQEEAASEGSVPSETAHASFEFVPADVDADPDEPLDLTDVDPELLDIFIEETTDILDHSDGLLTRLRDAPSEREPVVGLQRDLHTLKGGARMCGMMSMGELAHAMESVLEAAAEVRMELGARGLGVLEQGFDRLHGMLLRIQTRRAVALPEQLIAMFNALARGEVAPAPRSRRAVPAPTPEVKAPVEGKAAPVEEAAAPAEELAESTEATETVQPTRGKPSLKPLSAPVESAFDDDDDIGVRAPQEQVRIRADLLDRLVNYAGEVAIYRARLEQQLGTFRTHLDELAQTTTRLRAQLRKLEIETEAQISARYQRAGEGEEAFDPLELDRFSTQQQLTRALAESAADMTSLHVSLDDVTRQYETLLLQQSRVSSELQDGLMRTRMVPFDALVPRLRRVVRQTATETAKHIQLKVEGAQGEMDRNVLDRMTAPLEHMLRNAAVHGLETPQARREAGKPEEGTVTVSMHREGSEVVMVVADDGRGLDREAIRHKAIERGLLKADLEVSDNALYAFILESGFSTADNVSRLAGRGVGMDVVHNEIRQLGGSLQLNSTAGKGTQFTIRLPFTLAVTQAALVKIGETSFAVPISSVQGVGRIARAELEKQLASANPVYVYAGEDFAIHDLGRLLGGAPAKAQSSLQMPLLLSRSGDVRAAICVDEVLGSREIVVKPVGPQVSSIPGIFGATIMGDGGVMVILDVVPLVRRATAQAALVEEVAVVVPEQEVRRVPLVMVVDDSITMRKVTGRVLERNNMEVLAAKDGVDAIEKMVDLVPDLMLLDIEMPRMDGYELATHMRNDPRLRDVPIVMITSRTGEKHRQRAFEIGVNRYLGKPYQEAELMRNVFELLAPVHNNG